MDQTQDLGELASAWRESAPDLADPPDLPDLADLPDEPEFTALYEEHFGFIRSCLARLGVPHDTLDDACQEVFLVVHRRLGEFEHRSTLRTWLYAIARRVASNHHRATHRRDRRHAALAAVPVMHDDLEQIVLRHEGAVLLQAFLDELDEDKREVFVLGELEGMSRREMGEALGINPNTAYTRLQAARKIFDRTFADGPARDEFIAQARRRDPGTAEARARVWALMLPALPAAPGWTTGSTTLAGLWSQLGAFVVTVAVGTGIMAGVRAALPPAPVEPERLVDAASGPEAAARPRVPDAAARPPAAPEGAASPIAAPEVERRPPRRDLAKELELLDRASAELAAGRHQSALEQLRRHETHFPHGQLRAEREVLFIETLCATGQRRVAGSRARRFQRANPTSSLIPRVEASCAINPD